MNLHKITTAELKLSEKDCVIFFRKLLLNEASRVKINTYNINFSEKINVGDGGLDGVIEYVKPIQDDLIPQGKSGFQIKKSDLEPSDCMKELHKKNNLDLPLKEEVEKLLKENGTYVLVLFEDMPNNLREKRKKAIIDELSKCGYSNPKVRLYTSNFIIDFIERFPSLLYHLKPYIGPAKTYSGWSENKDVHDPKDFVIDELRNDIILTIRNELRKNNDSSTIIRIHGMSGLGKTRLIFETLSEDDIKERVIYVRADAFKNSELSNIMIMDKKIECIIVIDDCSIEDHEYFVNFFANQGSRIHILTISNEIGKFSYPTKLFRLEQLSNEKITDLIKSQMPGLPYDILNKWANFSDGYPKLSIMLIENYIYNPTSEHLSEITDSNLIDKLIRGTKMVSTDEFLKIKHVLMGISLFQKLGFKEELSVESKFVAELVSVPWNDFQRIVQEQKNRGIIQGEYYISVTPYLFSVHLAKEWWNTYGDNLSLDEFFTKFPSDNKTDMIRRFFSYIPYATTTEAGKNLVKNLLSINGAFADYSFLNSHLGSEFFLKLTEADPESSLFLLENTILEWNDEKLLNFIHGRSQIVWALQEIAIYKQFFNLAVTILMRLAETENQTYANNATGIFTDLFLPMPYGGPTEMAPIERLPILFQLFNSKSEKRRELAIKAFDRALETPPFHRIDLRGLETKEVIFWSPKDKDEIIHYYSELCTRLFNEIEKSNVSKKEILNLLLKHIRGIIKLHHDLTPLILNTLEKFKKFEWIDKLQILKAILEILYYDQKHLENQTINSLKQLSEHFTGNTFSDMLKRYVKVDFLEDYFNEEKKADHKLLFSRMKHLSNQILRNPEILKPELQWLATTESKRSYEFGHQLGLNDSDLILLERLIQWYKEIKEGLSLNFLRGYLAAVYEKNKELWDTKITNLSEDEFYQQYIPELVFGTGMSDNAALLILKLIKKGKSDVNYFYSFQYGSVINTISEPILIEWLEYLFSLNGTFIGLALTFIHYYYIFREQNKLLPKQLVFDILMHEIFWENPNNIPRNIFNPLDWSKVATKLIEQFSDLENEIIMRIFQYYGNEKSIVYGNTEIETMMLNSISKNKELFTNFILDRLISYRGNSQILAWLRGDNKISKKYGSLLNYLDLEIVWKWIDQDKQFRSEYFASFIPSELFYSTEKVCIAREFLIRYGDNDKVRKIFSSNYSTFFFTGSIVSHFTDIRNHLINYMKNENNKNIRKWITEYLETLNYQLNISKKIEEHER